MRTLDTLIESKYEEVRPYYEIVMKSDEFRFYADLILNLCHPKFLRIKFFDEFLKYYNIEKNDIELNQ